MNIDCDDDKSLFPSIAMKKKWVYTPFFNRAPTAQYHGQGICFNGIVYHFNPIAHANKGGWYSYYVPLDIKNKSVLIPTD